MALPGSGTRAGQTAKQEKGRTGREISSYDCRARAAQKIVNNKLLVIDVGGTHVKLMISRNTRRKFNSGPKMTPRDMVGQIKAELKDWKFDAVAVGFPAPVRDGRIVSDPKHRGKGWVG